MSTELVNFYCFYRALDRCHSQLILCTALYGIHFSQLKKSESYLTALTKRLDKYMQNDVLKQINAIFKEFLPGLCKGFQWYSELLFGGSLDDTTYCYEPFKQSVKNRLEF